MLGPGVIEDTLAGVCRCRMGVHEFYQVNTPPPVLYAKARGYAGLKPDDFLLDLCCGTGHDRAFDAGGLQKQRLVGVEVVPQAIEARRRPPRGWDWTRTERTSAVRMPVQPPPSSPPKVRVPT